MRKTLSILIGKIIIKFMNLLKFNASVFPGAIAKKIYPDLLYDIEYPKLSIFVTGSTGKGSTTKVVTQVLRDNNYKVITNDNGSNLINAFITLIIKNSSLSGKTKGDALVYEVDERFLKIITKYLKPNYLIINNITRDQPPRNSHPEKIFNQIKSAIPKGTHLILNVDDPFVNRFRIDHKGPVTTYGMDKNSYSYKTNLNNLDGAYCPICNSKLEYDFYHYGHIGSYHCPKYDFVRSTPDFEAKDIDVDNEKITINENTVNLPSNFLYTVYFVTGCYALSRSVGLKDEQILNVLNSKDIKTKRLTIYNYDNRKWQMLVSKNENNLSYKQSLDYIMHQHGDKTIILGFDSSSRRYKENDISWIWDIDFEELNDNSIKNIILIGKFCNDMRLRMEYAKINKNKLILVEDISNLAEVIKKKTTGNIYSMVCFDKEIELKRIIKEENND